MPVRKIPDNIACLSWDDVIEDFPDENKLQGFRCENCLVTFLTEPDVRFPMYCPNCGNKFAWGEAGEPCQ